MILARVVGNVTSTIKIPALTGHKLLLVKPVSPSGADAGKTICALDTVQAGPGDMVLVLDEGNSARTILGDSGAPVRTVIAGIVDSLDLYKL